MEEIWKSYKTKQADIEISNFGNVRGNKWHGKVFTPDVVFVAETGPFKGRRCIGSTANRIYLLEWIVFNGPVPKGYCIHHIDGNKSNDRLDNLQLMTSGEHSTYHHKDLLTEKSLATLDFLYKKYSHYKWIKKHFEEILHIRLTAGLWRYWKKCRNIKTSKQNIINK